ncbi:MAG: integration host factor subunit alpha [Acidobacteria bacterium]|nr:integration host factor subunit alpha [Acidobacteriota bacterium]
MTKADLVKAVYERHGGVSFLEAQRIVETVFDTMKGKLVGGEKVLLSGFGAFQVVGRKDRRGRNPQTGEIIVIHPRRSIVFRPSKLLRF